MKLYAMAIGALMVAASSTLAAVKLDTVIGEWATEGYGSRVTISECDDTEKQIWRRVESVSTLNQTASKGTCSKNRVVAATQDM